MFKNKFTPGLIMGIIIPIVLGFILVYLDHALTHSKSVNITGNSQMLFSGFKKSTIFLIAICGNLIPTFFANKKLMDEFIRGIMLPTMIFALIWFFYFKSDFL
jgi:hypothetical protein